MIKDKKFYHTFFSIAIMVILQNVVSLGVNMLDNIMLGRYGEAALSGVTAANQVQFVYQQLLIGIGDGIVILSSQYWGKRQTSPIKKVSAVGMRFMLVLCLLLFIVASIFPNWMIGLFTNDVQIIEAGAEYVNVIRFTYIFFGITSILLATLRSIQVVKIAFYLSLSTLLINGGLNWILIYGHFGFPRLGVTGAAIGTLVARMAELIWLVIYLMKKEKVLTLRIRDYLHVDRLLAKDYFKLSAPIILLQSLWGVNTALQTAVLGHLSRSVIVANSMASNLFLMVKSVAVGAASTASVLIGKAIGAGNKTTVRQYARTFQVMFLIMGVVCGAILFALTEPVLSLYSFTPESEYYARMFLHILCIVMVGMSYQMPVNSGIIKGGGDTRYVMIMDLISIWCIVIPVSFLAAFVWKLSPVIVVCCLNADQIFKCIPAFIKVNFGHWARKLTRDDGEGQV